MLDCIVVEPRESHDASIIWMHGLGASAHDFADMPRLIDRPGTRWIFPNAPVRPVTLNHGMRMRSWFDIRYLGSEPGEGPRECAEEADESAALVTALIEAERAKGIPAERIVLIGFSQGGAMSLHTGCRHPETLGGMACLSGYLLFHETHLEVCHAANRDTPVLVCHGTLDPMVPFEAGSMTAAFLGENGWPTTFESYPMQHEVCMPEIRRVGAFLAETLDQN